MDAYACAECEWRYNWTMGDRHRAVMRHELSHLIEQRDKADGSDVQVPTHFLINHAQERAHRGSEVRY